MSARRRWTAVAAVLALAYLFLYCSHPERPGIFADEANFSIQAFGWSNGGWPASDRSSALMMAPYIGALKSWIFFGLYRFLAPSVPLLRWVSLAMGAAFVAACAALGGLVAGEAGALMTGLLVLADPGVFFNVRHDYTGADVALTFLVLAALLLAKAKEKGSAARAAAGGLCLGLAFWSHLLVAVPVAAAALTILDRETLMKPRRQFKIASAGLTLGLTPLFLYYAFDHGGHLAWLVDTAHAHQSGPWPEALARHAVILWRCLTSPAEAYGALLPDPPMGPGTLVLGSWLAAAALCARTPGAPRAVTAMTALSAALLCLVPSFYSLHHVFIALYPWIYLPMAALFADAFAAPLAPWRRAALAAPALLCLGFSLRSTLWLRGAIMRDEVRPVLSVQVQDELSRFIASRGEAIAPISPVSGVEVLTGGRKAGDDSFSAFFLAPGLLARNVDEVGRMLQSRPTLFLLLSDGVSRGPFGKAREAFLSFARGRGLEPVLVHQVRFGPAREPVFDLFSLKARAGRAP